MINHLSVTILVDNCTAVPELETEHGLAFWIEADDTRILFDTGQSDLLVRNAAALGIDLATADVLVLSHGHYDHTGGVAEILRINPGVRVCAHPGILQPRFSRKSDGTIKQIGISNLALESLSRISDAIIWTSGATMLSPGIGITGKIPRMTNFEDTGGKFYLDKELSLIDPIDDDLSLYFLTTQGTVVITGCCHSGLINTLSYIRTLTNNTAIDTVAGGLHLLSATEFRMQKTGDYLEAIGIQRLIPCHCTGEAAIAQLGTRFGSRIAAGAAGMKF